jgi:eukaryotic-like serine/threonine-protein kinase
MRLGPGDRFDRYTIEGLLGEGGMGRVYCAHDGRLHRRVALKVVRFDRRSEGEPGTTTAGEQADASERLMREARAAAALDHPNAVSVFDVGEYEGALFIAMEFVPGKTLRSYVGDAGTTLDQKLRWLVDVARALDAAHARGLVHRDVKPENIMVREDGVVKVLDFGIAKRVTFETDTVPGMLMGTPQYLSPEQVRGQSLDGRADQFAWGVVAYQLLTGEVPWGDRTGVKLMLCILTGTPAAPSILVPSLPAHVDATILKTLAKSPADRFDSMELVADALEPFVRAPRVSLGDPIEVLATIRTEPAPPPSAPHRALVEIPPAAPTAEEPPPPPAPSAKLVDDPPGRRHAPFRTALAFALATLVVGGGALAFSRAQHAPSPSPSGSPSPSSSTSPSPSTTNPDAAAAYRSYTLAFHGGDFDAARQALERAVSFDPGFGAAYLRLAYFDSQVSATEASVRRDFKKATQLRDTLSDRDQLVLDALEPYLQRDPSDPAEADARLSRAADRYPNDAELAYLLGSVRYDRGRLAQALEAFTRAIEIDPEFALAWASKGGCQAYLGETADALASLDRCLAVSRSSTECLWYRAQIDEQEGACEREEADVRQWIARDPDDWVGYQWLASSLLAQGRSIETVQTALEERWVRAPPERKARIQLVDEIRLDAAFGAFADAEKKAKELEEHLASEPGALAHAESHVLLVRIYEETGRPEDARRTAEAFLKRRDAWAMPHRVDDRAIWEDPVPLMLGTLLETGALSATEFAARQRDWLNAWESKTSDAYVHYLWIYGYAAPASSAAGARAALDALPRFSPLPPFNPQTIGGAEIGKAYLLAGQPREALPYLRKATASCGIAHDPIVFTRASLHLGMALEATGDRAGACQAYRSVLDRWKGAKPRSVTLEEARRRAAALGCR